VEPPVALSGVEQSEQLVRCLVTPNQPAVRVDDADRIRNRVKRRLPLIGRRANVLLGGSHPKQRAHHRDQLL
jgi:hypothetical protein